ncbi:MAG: dockerin type I domain-containing protein, partial [Planctomycetota bacterium]
AYNQLVAGVNKPGEVPTAGWDLNLLDKRQTPQNSYTVTLTEPADKVITVTLVWNRHYADVSPFKAMPGKDSNLRLELWAVDPLNQGNDYLLDYSDSTVDNVEHIYAAADPGYSVYRIVLAFSENENQQESASNQRYGLAWNVSNRQPNDSIFWYDLNADGIVNELDFAIVLDNVVDSTASPESYLLGDITADGSIDVRDLEDLFKHDNRRAAWYVEPVAGLR